MLDTYLFVYRTLCIISTALLYDRKTEHGNEKYKMMIESYEKIIARQCGRNAWCPIITNQLRIPHLIIKWRSQKYRYRCVVSVHTDRVVEELLITMPLVERFRNMGFPGTLFISRRFPVTSMVDFSTQMLQPERDTAAITMLQ